MSNKTFVLDNTPDKGVADLAQIQTQAPPQISNLPFASDNRIFNIDLNTRIINAPSILSVSRDHKAGVIYFRTDRYYDYMDLAETICLVQYIIPGTKGQDATPYTYVVPFFDTQSEAGKIIFPWVIGGPATSAEGKIKYAVRFYRVQDNKLVYNLNTIPATSKIEVGLEADSDSMKVEYDEPLSSRYENLISQLSNQRTYWTIL